MINFRSHFAALVASSAVALAASPGAFADTPIHKVTGGGSAPIPGTEVESYGFQAQINADGTVKGKAVFQFRPQDARFFGDITCLHVNANDAWFGGELTQVDAEGFPPLPIYFVWQVVLLSLNPAFPETCTQEPVSPVPLIDLENGNIKVH